MILQADNSKPFSMLQRLIITRRYTPIGCVVSLDTEKLELTRYVSIDGVNVLRTESFADCKFQVVSLLDGDPSHVELSEILPYLVASA